MDSPSLPAAEGPSHPGNSLAVASHDVSEPILPGQQGEFSLEKTMREALTQSVLEFLPLLRSYSPPPRLEDSGITPRTLGVYFKDLRVVGAGASSTFQDTVGSRFNPKVAYDGIRNARRPKSRDILSGFSGVVRPGEMLRKFPHTIGSDWVGILCAPQSSLAAPDQDALPSSRCLRTNAKLTTTYRVKFTTIPSLQTR